MFDLIRQDIQNNTLKETYGDVKVYTKSLSRDGNDALVMVRKDGKKQLLALGRSGLFQELEGEDGGEWKLAPLTHGNRLVLNAHFPYTVPQANTARKNSMGLGDRLGEATPGHIAALGDAEVFPIFAQQSIRELNFTARTYDDVVDAAAFAVFQEGYKTGYGADGDHLKTKEDIVKTLAMGATMITLDSSEKIDNSISGLSAKAQEEKYKTLDPEVQKTYEDLYLDKTVEIPGLTLTLTKETLLRDVLIYHNALDFITEVYEEIIRDYPRPVDFEVSIDETVTPTDVEAHYLIAAELKRRGVVISTMAPRFLGEFQKGIDYIGDLDVFEADLKKHVSISEAFGYRLSIHSGSDKFSIFPILARNIPQTFHVKTAGTSWLEFIHVLAEHEPKLYRDIRRYALQAFPEATKSYHVTTDLTAIKDVDKIPDGELPRELKDNNVRQLLHITFGFILRDTDDEGNFLFKHKLERAFRIYEEEYKEHLKAHIGRHLDLLSFR